MKNPLPVIRQSQKASPEVKAIADSVAQLSGQKGSGLDKALTLRDLAKLNGFSIRNVRGKYSAFFETPPLKPVKVYLLPPKPENVEYLPTFETIFIQWDDPDLNAVWFAQTEIYRSSVNDETPNPSFTDAVLIGTTINPFFTDYVQSGLTYRYFIRHVNLGNQSGPLDNTNGTDVKAYSKPADVLAEYSKDIYQGENYQWLRSELGAVSGLNRIVQQASPESGLSRALQNAEDMSDLLAELALQDSLSRFIQKQEVSAQFSKNYARLSSGIHAAVSADEAYVLRVSSLESQWTNELEGEINARIETFESALTSPTGAIATQLSELSVSYNGEQVSLQTLSSTIANSDGKFEAQWGVKSNVGDLQGGVGFLNDGAVTSFVVDAKVFAVTGGGDEKLIPFVIKDGKTVIAEALIDTAVIYNLIAANVTAEKVIASISLSSPEITGGSITGTTLNINDKMDVDSEGKLTAIGAELKEVTIKNSDGDIIFSSTGMDYSSLNNKPALGALAELDSVSAENIGNLAEKVDEQITTVVDAALIKTLVAGEILAVNIYAENIEGDVVDMITKTTTYWESMQPSDRILEFTVTPQPFSRTVVVSGLQATKGDRGHLTVSLWNGNTDLDEKDVISGSTTQMYCRPLVAELPPNTTGNFSVKIDVFGGFGSHWPQSAVIQAFKTGSSIS